LLLIRFFLDDDDFRLFFGRLAALLYRRFLRLGDRDGLLRLLTAGNRLRFRLRNASRFLGLTWLFTRRLGRISTARFG